MGRREGKARREKWLNLLYVLPMMMIFLAFIIYPITQVFQMSFYERKVNGEMLFVGLRNFVDLFTNSDTPRMFLNTFIWVFAGTGLKLLIGLLLALILYQSFPGKKALTAIMLIPYAMPAAVSCMIWRLMYNPMFGHLIQLLRDVHILEQPVDFLGNTQTSLIAVMVVNIWAVAPFCALNILSSMYAIPTYIYEAARIDGAGGIQQFFKITLPLIASSVRTLGLLIGIWAFNTFDVIYMMTTGGPANSSSIMVNFIYQHAFQFNNRGYSAAISVVSFILLSIFAVMYVNSKGEETSYE
mgnify:CR=1 FL=1